TIPLPFPIVNAGFIDDEARLALAFRAADVLLMPSLADNFPFVVLEALACGVPVAAFAVGGLPEQLGHGNHGLLANPPNTGELARNLATLLDQPALARSLGDAGRLWVQRTCGFDLCARANLAVYNQARELFQRRHSADPTPVLAASA